MSKIKTKYLIIIAIFLTASVSFGLYYKFMTNKDSGTSSSNSPDNNIDYSPGTKEDQKEADQKKAQLSSNNPQTPNNKSSGKNVKPIITYAGQFGSDIEIGGYVPGIMEDGGECTAQLKKDGVVLEKRVKSIRNANSVDCPAMIFELSKIPSKGIWSVTIAYYSSSASGVSEVKNLEIK